MLAGESSSDTAGGCPVCLREATHRKPTRGVAAGLRLDSEPYYEQVRCEML